MRNSNKESVITRSREKKKQEGNSSCRFRVLMMLHLMSLTTNKPQNDCLRSRIIQTRLSPRWEVHQLANWNLGSNPIFVFFFSLLYTVFSWSFSRNRQSSSYQSETVKCWTQNNRQRWRTKFIRKLRLETELKKSCKRRAFAFSTGIFNACWIFI